MRLLIFLITVLLIQVSYGQDKKQLTENELLAKRMHTIAKNITNVLDEIGSSRLKKVGVNLKLFRYKLEQTTVQITEKPLARQAINRPSKMTITYAKNKINRLRAFDLVRLVIHENLGVQEIEKGDQYSITFEIMHLIRDQNYVFESLIGVLSVTMLNFDQAV